MSPAEAAAVLGIIRRRVEDAAESLRTDLTPGEAAQATAYLRWAREYALPFVDGAPDAGEEARTANAIVAECDEALGVLRS